MLTKNEKRDYIIRRGKVSSNPLKNRERILVYEGKRKVTQESLKEVKGIYIDENNEYNPASSERRSRIIKRKRQLVRFFKFAISDTNLIQQIKKKYEKERTT